MSPVSSGPCWSPPKNCFSKYLLHFTLSLTCLCRWHFGALWFSRPGRSTLHRHCNTCHLQSNHRCLWGISRWHAELGPWELLPPAEISQRCHLQQAKKVRAVRVQFAWGHWSGVQWPIENCQAYFGRTLLWLISVCFTSLSFSSFPSYSCGSSIWEKYPPSGCAFLFLLREPVLLNEITQLAILCWSATTA